MTDTNSIKYCEVFTKTFHIEENILEQNPRYNELEGWDSVGHMQLMAALEVAFGVSLDIDDIIDFDSFEKGKEILGKYDVA